MYIRTAPAGPRPSVRWRSSTANSDQLDQPQIREQVAAPVGGSTTASDRSGSTAGRASPPHTGLRRHPPSRSITSRASGSSTSASSLYEQQCGVGRIWADVRGFAFAICSSAYRLPLGVAAKISSRHPGVTSMASRSRKKTFSVPIRPSVAGDFQPSFSSIPRTHTRVHSTAFAGP